MLVVMVRDALESNARRGMGTPQSPLRRAAVARLLGGFTWAWTVADGLKTLREERRSRRAN